MTSFDENDIFEIKFSEAEEYCNLIFESKIKEFAFYYHSENDKGEKIVRCMWMYSLNSDIYFVCNNCIHPDVEDIIRCAMNSNRLKVQWGKKKNNFDYWFLNLHSLTFSKEDIIMFWCPSLVSTLKPAKR